jgi:hypothetical protein
MYTDPLYHACRVGDVRYVEIELSEDAELVHSCERTGATPLHHAAFYGHCSVIRALVECGAVVNHQDIYGFSPLHLAASHDQLDACRLLIRLGADTSLRDADGDSAEGRALLFRHWAVSQVLASHAAPRSKASPARFVPLPYRTVATGVASVGGGGEDTLPPAPAATQAGVPAVAAQSAITLDGVSLDGVGSPPTLPLSPPGPSSSTVLALESHTSSQSTHAGADAKLAGSPHQMLFEARALFDRYDSDGSGTIDCDELLNLLEECGHSSIPPEKKQQWFLECLARHDKDGSGAFEFSEFVHVYNAFKPEGLQMLMHNVQL